MTTRPQRSYQAGELARLAGVSTDTLRHYERKGVLPAPGRKANGYRQYPAQALDRVRLVRHALSVGFTLDELATILGERDRGDVPCNRVRQIAADKLADLEARLREMQLLRDSLCTLLQEWDARLAGTDEGRQARLLEMLAETTTPPHLLPASRWQAQNQPTQGKQP